MTLLVDVTWVDVCDYDDLLPERGVRALVGGHHVAVFRAFDGEVYAVDDVDPYSGVSVLSRGIVGTRDDTPAISSPMFKQSFDLRTGCCLDDPSVSVRVFAARVVDGRLQIAGP